MANFGARRAIVRALAEFDGAPETEEAGRGLMVVWNLDATPS